MSLRAERLQFTYGAGVPVLRDVSLEVAPGRVVGLFGPNGSGKSTLLRCLNGGLRPQSGSVSLNGQPLLGMQQREIAARIAVVPQDTPQDVPFTVEQVVALGRHPHQSPWPSGGEADPDLVDACLRRVGVADLAGRAFAQLSGGERQRVVIARALAQLGRYLLLDEPATHLDIAHQLELYRLVRSIAAEGIGVAMICHDLMLSPLFVDHAVLLSKGQVYREGNPRHVFDAQCLTEVFGTAIELDWQGTTCSLHLPTSD